MIQPLFVSVFYPPSTERSVRETSLVNSSSLYEIATKTKTSTSVLRKYFSVDSDVKYYCDNSKIKMLGCVLIV